MRSLGRLLDLGTVRQHVLALQRADVVEIDVYGQPRMAEDEQVQGGAALKDPLASQRRVGVQDVQEMHQMEDLLDRTLVESVGSG